MAAFSNHYKLLFLISDCSIYFDQLCATTRFGSMYFAFFVKICGLNLAVILIGSYICFITFMVLYSLPNKICPVIHQASTFFQQVCSLVGLLYRVAHSMS